MKRFVWIVLNDTMRYFADPTFDMDDFPAGDKKYVFN